MALTKVSSGIIESAPIGIHSGGTVIHSSSTALNFIGVGNTFSVNGGTTNISISGGGIQSNDNIRAYKNTIEADITLPITHPTAVTWIDNDLTLDIEEGVTVTVDDGVAWNVASPF